MLLLFRFPARCPSVTTGGERPPVHRALQILAQSRAVTHETRVPLRLHPTEPLNARQAGVVTSERPGAGQPGVSTWLTITKLLELQNLLCLER